MHTNEGRFVVVGMRSASYTMNRSNGLEQAGVDSGAAETRPEIKLRTQVPCGGNGGDGKASALPLMETKPGPGGS